MSKYIARLWFLVFVTYWLALPAAHAQTGDFEYVPPTIEYDAGTGNVWLLNVQEVFTIQLESAASMFIEGKTKTLDYQGCYGLDAMCVYDRAPTTIIWGRLDGLNFERKFVGRILPPSLTREEIEADLTLAVKTTYLPTVELPGVLNLLGEMPPTLDLPDPLPAASSASTAVPEAWYDPATGAITFRNVVDLVGLRFNSSGKILIGGQMTDLDGAAPSMFGVPNDQAPDFIEFGNLTGMNFDSSFAGNLLPAGLSLQEVRDDITFLYRSSADPTTDQFGLIFAVPEPSSVALVFLGLVFSTCRRSYLV